MRFLIGALAPLSLLLASPVWGQDYLYQPHPVVQGEQPTSADGVLVREVLVKKGDTLSHISKRFSGRGAYYPQIMLFNTIKNPHRIYPGDLLRVPISGQRAAQAATGRQATTVAAPAARLQPAKAPAASAKVAPVSVVSKAAADQASYSRALAAFKRGACSEAVALFDRFIADFPQSSLVPEAILNRAECYLTMSGS